MHPRDVSHHAQLPPDVRSCPRLQLFSPEVVVLEIARFVESAIQHEVEVFGNDVKGFERAGGGRTLQDKVSKNKYGSNSKGIAFLSEEAFYRFL